MDMQKIAQFSAAQQAVYVHFYSDTPSYIFLITNDSHYYSVEKREGLISASLSFDAVPSTVEQVRFINLLNKSGAERSRWYIE